MLLCWIYQNFTIFYFYILQSSVATQLGCGKKNNDFIANSLLNPQVKKMLKSADIWQSY